MADVRIERVTNGYEICCEDPSIVAANRKTGPDKPWKNPRREYVFRDLSEVLDFLKKNLDKALPADEYDSAFELALESEDDD